MGPFVGRSGLLLPVGLRVLGSPQYEGYEGQGTPFGELAGVVLGIASSLTSQLPARWKDITKINVKTWRRFTLIKREWGYKPIGLYCTPDNFPQTMDILRHYVGDKREIPAGPMNQYRFRLPVAVFWALSLRPFRPTSPAPH